MVKATQTAKKNFLTTDVTAALGFCGMILSGFRGWELWGVALTSLALGLLWMGARR